MEGMAADYAAGMGCVLLARKYGVSDNTVLDRLKAAGVEIRARGKLSQEQVVELFRLRAEGWTQQALADRYRVTRTAVSLRLSRQNAGDHEPFG